MAIDKITREQISELCVEGLAKRPNQKGRYGRSGLSADELRRAFDGLALLAIEKINEIIEYIGQNGVTGEGSGSGSSSGSSELPSNIEALLDGKADKTHTHDERYYTATTLNLLLAACLPKSPDGTNELIGEDGKISATYLPESEEASAAGTALADEGGYYEASDVEGALAELGAQLSELDDALGRI